MVPARHLHESELLVNVSSMTDRMERLLPWRKPKNNNNSVTGATREPPLREELFSIEQLERHARSVAISHELATGDSPDKLIPRLNENARILIETYDLITAAVSKNRRVTPAAEWLLDNFYLIEEQIRTARKHLPPSYSRELPRLANGPAARFPRAYGIALELIAHVDGRVDAASLDGFIASYQTVTPLKLGELWAIPIVLRLGLLENLRRVAVRVADGRRDRDTAEDWADRMLAVAERNPTDLVLVLADMARANPPMTSAFLSELTRHLRGQNPYFAFANSWLEHRVSEQGSTIEQLVQAEGQAQAVDQVSIGNSISSLRFLTSTDWRDFVEKHSLVEQTLRTDPAEVYAAMDFATRDRYRHAVEQIARRSKLSEYDVARKSVQLAEASAADKPKDRSAHVGYYLIDRGRSALERIAEMRLSPRIVLSKFGRRFALFFYLSSVILIALAGTAVVLQRAHHFAAGIFALLLLSMPALFCAAQLGLNLTNWLTTMLVKPRPLARLDFKKGIPPEHRTIVVIPTMLTSAQGISDLLEGIEIRYLANRDPSLHFALLTDFQDAPAQTTPADEALLDQAADGIAELIEKYASDRSDLFFLFHRPRRWNAAENLWMGYERKRGKLGEFNEMLRGDTQRFSRVVGDLKRLPEVRYVITLDTDTQLPREAAREMVGAMAHTLNRPVFDEERCRVTDGYTILQPRVGVSLPSAHRSLFVRLFAGDSGVDPYTRVVSDVYQDLFGEGSFIGKGIYDVESFQKHCGKFPDNTILSHDLLESAYSRSALLSDVELYEEYPSRYQADVSRRHRWIRGDWQIATWLFPSVPDSGKERVDNPISVLSKWKIFDNLRRSLVPVAMMLLLLGSWLLASRPLATSLTLFVLLVVGLVPLLQTLWDLIRKPTEVRFQAHLRLTGYAFLSRVAQFLFSFVFLPYDAFISVDAIMRTLVRMTWTRTRLLEWTTASDAERTASGNLLHFCNSMWILPGIAVASALVLTLWRSQNLPPAAALLCLWFVAPLCAWWLSRPLHRRAIGLTSRQRQFLGKAARRTWRYFETFVTAEENWLPPDNFQEYPLLATAARTSPTNIGMALLADLTAYDFGYCSVSRVVDRITKAFGTLKRMEQHRGHFYNWYDTRSLQPLQPRYISMVDSGNLAGHLLVLRMGLLEISEVSIRPANMLSGLRDCLGVLLDVSRGFVVQTEAAPRLPMTSANIRRKMEGLEEYLKSPRAGLTSTLAALDRCLAVCREFIDPSTTDEELQWWSKTFERDCLDHRADLLEMATWLALPAAPDALWKQPSSEDAARRDELRDLLKKLDANPSLKSLAALRETAIPLVESILKEFAEGTSSDARGCVAWLDQLHSALTSAATNSLTRVRTLENMAEQCREFANMDFSFLYDSSRHLFSIGYNVSDHRMDNSFYDLLGSEARLGSFVTYRSRTIRPGSLVRAQPDVDCHWRRCRRC